MLHIEHSKVTLHGRAWCGAAATGPRIGGENNFLSYEGAEPVCATCVAAVLDRIIEVVKRCKGAVNV